MSSINRTDPPSAVHVLQEARRKGVRLWAENGSLRYQAPRGALSAQELERLRLVRGQLIALLEAGSEAPEESASFFAHARERDHAPLTLSQLAHRNLYELGKRPAGRQIVTATRIEGRLGIELLEQSLREVVRRHAALRTLIVEREGTPVQEISSSADVVLEIKDLAHLPPRAREPAVLKEIEELVLEPIDIASGPLFGVRLVRVGAREHVLVLAMEHIISDGYSMKILLRDLWAAYSRAARGLAFSLPPVPIQFADYAVMQERTLPLWLEKHGPHMREHLAGCGRLGFPSGDTAPLASKRGWSIVPFEIDRELRSQLAEWSRQRRTTLAMSVFTAYVAVTLRWCEASEAVFQFQGDGRVDAKLEDTIGFLASVLYLRMELLESDSFATLLQRIVEEYCRAYDHLDHSYLEAQVPRPEVTRNTVFNWIPRASTLSLPELEGTEHALDCSLVQFPNPILKTLDRDNEPCVVFYDGGEQVNGAVYFPANRYAPDMMERFVASFLLFVRGLLRQPERIDQMPLL